MDSLKRYVLSLVLKQLTVFAFLMFSGKEFHSFGPVNEKALPPQKSVLIFLGWTSKCDDDLKIQDERYSSIKGIK